MAHITPGKTIGAYQIEEQLGEGGFATVFRAFQPSLDRKVAIKMLDERLARNPRFLQRFRQEVEATFSLKHPNIVRVYDFVEMEDYHFMVMEYVEGPTLRDVLNHQGELDSTRVDEELTRLRDQTDEDETILKTLSGQYQPLELGLVGQISRSILRGLEFAHQKGIIHRDVKPENVLLGKDGVVRLADFGIARVQEETRLTRTGTRIGTIAYMSPEQITDQKDLDGRSDLYSFGILLYEMLTGTVPFVGHDTAVWTMHLRQQPLPPGQLRHDIPPALEAIVLKCLAKDPAARYRDADEVVRALEACVKITPLSEYISSPSLSTPPTTAEAEKPLTCCARCGYTYEASPGSRACPLCDQPQNDSAIREEVVRRGHQAESFISGFNLPQNLSLEVRDYEYHRTILPRLEQMIRSLADEWAKRMMFGGVISPVSKIEEQPNDLDLLKTMRDLFSTAALLESRPMEAFVVSVETRRDRRRQVAYLQSMAVMLAGTLHSLRATRQTSANGMQAEYQAARRCHEQAAGLARELSPELYRAAQLSAALAEMMINFPQTRSVGPEVERLARENAEMPGRLSSSGGDRRTAQEYQNAYQRSQQRLADLRRKVENAVQRARKSMETSRSQFASIQQAFAAARATHLKNLEKLDAELASLMKSLPRNQTILKYVINIGPLIAGLIVYLISKSDAPDIPNSDMFLGLDGQWMPIIVTAGMIALGYCTVKLKNIVNLSPADIFPTIVAAVGTICTAVFWSGFGLYTQNKSATTLIQYLFYLGGSSRIYHKWDRILPLQAVVIAFYLVAIGFGIFWLNHLITDLLARWQLRPVAPEPGGNIKKAVENRRPRTRESSIIPLQGKFALGLMLSAFPAIMEIRVFNLREYIGNSMPFMIFGRLIFLVLGLGLGILAWDLERRANNFQQIKTQKLIELNERNEHVLQSLRDRRMGLVSEMNAVVNRELKEADDGIAEIHHEADLLCRRLLRQKPEVELAACRDLEQAVLQIRSELGKI